MGRNWKRVYYPAKKDINLKRVETVNKYFIRKRGYKLKTGRNFKRV